MTIFEYKKEEIIYREKEEIIHHNRSTSPMKPLPNLCALNPMEALT